MVFPQFDATPHPARGTISKNSVVLDNRYAIVPRIDAPPSPLWPVPVALFPEMVLFWIVTAPAAAVVLALSVYTQIPPPYLAVFLVTVQFWIVVTPPA